MDEKTAVRPDVSDEIRAAARQAGGGWLDEVAGDHAPPVPLSAVRGAWKLDANGELTGEYVANPDFSPVRRSRCPYGRTG
jgi:hypothetical protein